MKTMRNIQRLIAILFCVALGLTSCEEKESMLYNGPQIANFGNYEQYYYFAFDKDTSEYDLQVGVLRPADNDIKLDLEITGNSRPAGIFVKDEDGNIVAGKNFSVTVKKGNITAPIKVMVKTNAMRSQATDTLKVKLTDPMLGAGGTSHLASNVTLKVYPYCTFTRNEMAELLGTYTANQTSGPNNPTYVIQENPYTVRVKSVVGDTMFIEGLFHVTPQFTTRNNTYRVYVDRSTTPYKLYVNGGDYLFTWTTAPYANAGDMYTTNYYKTEYGSIDFCSKTMTIKSESHSPTTGQDFGQTSTFIVNLTKN